ncbi:MAG: hypothetical protein K0R24_351 [Gammaproteobacteria bacterium]|jgi:hypothetical protein|nr:hypothetical protein [Gammaproteobacteria bacterium]
MRNVILKIEQLSQAYYPIIRNFPLIKEFSMKRLQLQQPLHSKIEEEKRGDFIIEKRR